MADDLDLDLSDGDDANRAEKRIKDLSGKVKEQALKAEEEAKARADAETRAKAMEKERDFYSSFADSTSKYPSAGAYKDAIKEKVMGGYSVEDATVSVLAKEGKLNAPPLERESPAGGSASNSLGGGGAKTLGEMTREEKRAALKEAESKGDVALS